jgi:hypothetical protein
MAKPWDFTKAMEMLPHLAHCAKERRKITYGELGALVDVFPLYMTKPLDVLRDRILLEHHLPRIDALVVNQETGEVGEHFYAEGFGSMSAEERTSLLDYERQKVFDYPRWDEIIGNLQRHYGCP